MMQYSFIHIKQWIAIVMFIGFTLFASSCEKGTYSKIRDEEVAKGVRNDSLFLGLDLGMTSKEFYSICWDLNKKGILGDGPGNMTAQYTIKDYDHLITMNFYPDFKEGKIYTMPVDFAYKGWSPWNRHLFSDSLEIKVIDMLENWYGKELIEMEHPKFGKTYFAIEGNRQIIVYRKSDKDVRVIYKDLFMEEEDQEE